MEYNHNKREQETLSLLAEMQVSYQQEGTSPSSDKKTGLE